MAIAFSVATKAVGNGTTSAAVDASAANGSGLFVAIVVGSAPVSAPSDSSSNTWTGLTARAGVSGGEIRFYYKIGPVATASHTFTNNAALGMIEVLVFSAVASFDQETGNPGFAQAGAITPPANGHVFIAGWGGGLVSSGDVAIDSGFTLVDQTNVSGGVNYSDAAAYFIQTTAASKDPIWSASVGNATAVLATFAPGSGGGGSNWAPMLSRTWNRLIQVP